MRARPAAAVLGVIAATISAAGCIGDTPGDKNSELTVRPPKPVPAISRQGAQQVLKQYLAGITKANATLDRTQLATVQTGSALQLTAAQYKVFKRNDLRYWKVRYTSALGASPKEVGYPHWFFVAATDKGAAPATRDLLVFVQDKKGTPWRVAYAPYSRVATGPLGPGVDVADYPSLVAPGDTHLVAPPGKVAAVLADVVTRGGKSVFASRVGGGRFLTSSRQSLADNRRAFTGNGWSGTSKAVAARTPVYAVRTTSGGALVWFGIDFRHTYKRTGTSTGMTWQTSQYGDLHKGFGIPSTITSYVVRQERNEVVAYIPPQGKGRIVVIGNRWFPLAVAGR
jgi:hypothetical protein